MVVNSSLADPCIKASEPLMNDVRIKATRERGPEASSQAAHNRMVANRSKNTKPELALRSLLHRRGFRFRVDRAPLAGVRFRADVVFGSERIAVFVDGCYWHACPVHGTQSKTNSAFWIDKLETNQRRDEAINAMLIDHDWWPIRVWEHEPVELAALRIERAIAIVRGSENRGSGSV